METLSSIARPYALAAFEFARDQDQLAAWRAFLLSAASIAKEPTVAQLLENPETSSEKLADLFQGILVSLLNTERKNFLLLIAQNKRFMLLPAIAKLFDAYYAAYEKISTVRVTTAVEIEDAYSQKLAQVLAKRIQHEVTLKCDVDPTILGGAIIRIGDDVIDGSLRGKLSRLLEFSLR